MFAALTKIVTAVLVQGWIDWAAHVSVYILPYKYVDVVLEIHTTLISEIIDLFDNPNPPILIHYHMQNRVSRYCMLSGDSIH